MFLKFQGSEEEFNYHHAIKLLEMPCQISIVKYEGTDLSVFVKMMNLLLMSVSLISRFRGRRNYHHGHKTTGNALLNVCAKMMNWLLMSVSLD